MPGQPGQLTLGSGRAPLSGSGGVLVGAHDGGIDDHFPVDLTDRVGPGLGMGEQPLPGAVSLPAAEPLIQVCQGR